MNYHDIKVGARVRIHPASDWFMRGAKFATVTSKCMGIVRVKLEGIGPKGLRPVFRTNALGDTNAPGNHDVKDLLPL